MHVNKIANKKKLAETHPEITKQWHSTLNIDVLLADVTSGSNKYAWWLCEEGHEYRTKICHRTGGSRCPNCFGKKLSEKRSLAYKRPDLAKEFHPTKNGTLKPSEIHASSRDKVWWVCVDGHEWESTVDNRNKGNGCPVCANREITNENSLAVSHPELLKEWHPTKNGSLTPHDICAGSNKSIWWLCDKGHEWPTKCVKRAGPEQTGCPYCSGNKTDEKSSLQVTHPELAKEWHLIKNGKLSPADVRAGSNRNLWWQCEFNHEWQATVCNRLRPNARGCPRCNSGWTIENILLFVRDLLPYLYTLEPVERYDLFQENGLLSSNSKARSFIQDLITKKIPQDVLEKIVNKDIPLDAYLQDEQGLLGVQSNVFSLNAPEHKDSFEGIDIPIVQTKDVFKMLESNIMTYSADAEKIDFLIKSACAKIWRHAFAQPSEAELQVDRYNGDNEYARQVKQLFMAEYNGAKHLEIPAGYSIQSYAPNLMQRYIAYLIKTRKRIGNWSGTGAGKTLSATLASRVIDAQITIICCPNNVIDTWKRQINEAYPDSLIHTKEIIAKLMPIVGKHQYLILNYDFFQQTSSESKLQVLAANCNIDFIVIDEIHFSKQRKAKVASKRKILISTFLSEITKKNVDLHVLGMSATPVINELFEGKTLIELVTGVYHDDLNTTLNLPNCVALYKKFVTNGVRYLPRHEETLDVHIEKIDCGGFIPRLLGKKALEREAIFTEAKIPFILEQLRPKTIIYTYYRDGIENLLQQAISQQGWRVGFFNGDTKEALKAFLGGDVDILIATNCLGTGIDRLQYVCNRLIINSLPWTHAEFQQLVGRIYRQGQKKKTVDVFIPLAFAEINGEIRSSCANRWERIKNKETFADAAVDGTIPEEHIKSQHQVEKEYMKWLGQVEAGNINEIERQEIVLSFRSKNRQIIKRTPADFVQMNSGINCVPSYVTHQRFLNNPDDWYAYHESYGEARQSWEIVPYEEAINWCKQRPHLVVGDFGCGEAFLAQQLQNKVYSFDHVAINDNVIACDIVRVPLEDGALDAAIYSLSLMGSNFVDYLRESYRCLKLDGRIWIAEPTSRIEDIELFKDLLFRLGFDVRSVEQKSKFTFIEAWKSGREVNEVIIQQMKNLQILL